MVSANRMLKSYCGGPLDDKKANMGGHKALGRGQSCLIFNLE